MNKAKETEQKEIVRIKLSDNRDLVAFLVDNKKPDLRVFTRTDSHIGAKERGFRFYLFGNNWVEFKKLIDKIDKAYNEIGWAGSTSQRAAKQRDRSHMQDITNFQNSGNEITTEDLDTRWREINDVSAQKEGQNC